MGGITSQPQFEGPNDRGCASVSFKSEGMLFAVLTEDHPSYLHLVVYYRLDRIDQLPASLARK